MTISGKSILLILVALAALVPTLAPASAAAADPPPPNVPCRFYGTILLDGLPVPMGTVITATISGDTWTTTTPALVEDKPAYGNSTFLLQLEPLPGSSYSEGTEVVFTIAGYEADERGYWETGGNVRLDLFASVPPVPSTPSPTPTVAPTPTPTPTPPPPTPIPTVAPAPVPPGQDTGTAASALNTAISALCIGILIVCVMFAAYLVWKYRIRPAPQKGARPRPAAPRAAAPAQRRPEDGKADLTTPASETMVIGTAEGVATAGSGPYDPVPAAIGGLGWQDRLMLAMMSNRLVLRILSSPMVMKVITWELKAFIAITSLFKRKQSKGDDMRDGEIERTAADVEVGGDGTTEAEGAGEAIDTAGLDALAAIGASQRWQDRLMLKMMSNKIVLKIFSNPVVMKVITWEMNAFMAVASLFKRK